MKKNTRVKKALSLFIISSSAITLTACASITAFCLLDNQPNANRVIPLEYLDIEKNEEGEEILRGFKEEITIKDIRDNKYNILSIPRDVTFIAPYAFAFCFDGLCCHVNTLILNKNLKVIDTGAFMRCSGLKTVYFESENIVLTTIGNQAFEYCGIESDLILPSTVTTIGDSAFRWCYSLSKIYIPSSVTNVGYFAFAKCTNVSNLEFGHEYIPEWMYEYKFIFQHFGDDVEEGLIIVDDSNQTVDEWNSAMNTMQDLSSSLSVQPKHVTPREELPLKFLYIDNVDKDNCILRGFSDGFDRSTLSKYSVIFIPPYVTEIADEAFSTQIGRNCNITLEGGEGLYKIGSHAFNICPGLVGPPILPTQFKEPEDEEDDPLPPTLDECAYANTHVSGNVVLNNILVRSYAFENTRIDSLTIQNLFPDIQDNEANPDIDTSLPSHLADGCSQLRLIDFSFYQSEVPAWSVDADFLPFVKVHETGNLILNENLTETEKTQWLANAVIWGLTKLNDTEPISQRTYWTVPQHIDIDPQTIPEKYYVSYKNQQILAGLQNEIIPTVHKYQDIDIPMRTRYILDDAFNNVFIDGIEIKPKIYATWSLNLPLSLKTIGNRAFYGCTGLGGQLSFPSSIKEIGDYAFYGCYNLTEQFSLPSAIEKLGDYAFANCSLSWSDNLIIPGTLREIGSKVFQNVMIKKLTFHKSRGPCIIGDDAFLNIVGLRDIDLTDFDVLPDNWILSHYSFNTSYVPSGTIDVKDELIDEWSNLLYKHGLPEEWEII